MNANVLLHFKVRPDDSILQRSAYWESQPIFGVRGLRVHFSAQRFFEYSSSEQIKILLNKIIEYAETQNFNVVIDQELIGFRPLLTSNVTFDGDYSAGLPSEIIYLYKDAIFGLPRLVELQQQGFEVISWESWQFNFQILCQSMQVELEKTYTQQKYPDQISRRILI